MQSSEQDHSKLASPPNYEWTSLAPLLSLSPFPSLAPPPRPLSSLYPVFSFPLQYRQLASFQKSIFLAGKSESQHYTQHCKLFAYDGQLHCSLRENANYGYPTTSGKPHWYSLTLRPHPAPPPSVTCAALLRSLGVWGAPEAQHGPFVDEPVLSVLLSGYGRAYLTPPQRPVLKMPRGNRDRDLTC